MQTTVSISGMNSAHSVRAVFTSLTAVEGISRADVTLGRAVVEHESAISADEIREAIGIAGYEVTSVSENRRILPLAT